MFDKENPKIVFAPGCFDSFEGTQEELDSLIRELTQMAESGELLENAYEVDFDSMPQADIDSIVQLIRVNEPRSLQ